ncbi:MAG TPA: AIR synthase related protein, partial [Acidimicrobiales bacterium]|nr:AIR synthase related protein [Acidimicrobiales bacterium]
PAATLHEDAPVYDRPRRRPEGQDALVDDEPPTAIGDAGRELLHLLRDPSWVYRQYDHQLFLNTVEGPGGDAALLRLRGPGVRPSEPGRVPAIALSTDGNARWCALDPRHGTALTVAESALNVACVGAQPVALVNCLNFGNPEHPEVMWQLSEAIDGMAEACRALEIPVIGGNVSLYNESRGRDIDPTPVVGTLGLVEHLERRPPGLVLRDGDDIVLVQAPGTRPALGGSSWAAEIHDHRGGSLAGVDWAAHRALLDLVRDLAGAGRVSGIHDVSGGGLAVALAEMAVASGVGFRVEMDLSASGLFGEAPSRVLVSVAPALMGDVVQAAAAAGLEASTIGTAGGARLVVGTVMDLALAEATRWWRDALPGALALTPGGSQV